MEIQVTQDEVTRIFPQVAQIIADALGCDREQVRPDVSLIDDLGAESIDFLDIVFRLERGFGIKIPRGQILEEARGELSEAEFVQRGRLTEAGLRRLQEYLAEVPRQRFRPGMKLADVPALFTPQTFCTVVVRALSAGS
jgi:acyl carrier protein